jgi:hypothetical protein
MFFFVELKNNLFILKIKILKSVLELNINSISFLFLNFNLLSDTSFLLVVTFIFIFKVSGFFLENNKETNDSIAIAHFTESIEINLSFLNKSKVKL